MKHIFFAFSVLTLFSFVTMTTFAYDATVPVTQFTNCIFDYCSQKPLGGTLSCLSYHGPPATTTCASFNGCYTASPIGDICATNVALEQYAYEKHYRLSRAYGYNPVHQGAGVNNFGAFQLVFSDLLSTQPDIVYLFGSPTGSLVTDDISFDQEVIGIYTLPNATPDFEGLFFLLQDGSIKRIGQDQDLGLFPAVSEFTILNARLIGFTAKFASESGNYPTENVMELGIITDTQSCEELVFTSPDPFTNMVADAGDGLQVSQTRTIATDTAWGYCDYTRVISPSPAWLTHSNPSVHDLMIAVQSTDIALSGTTTTFTVTLTPDYQDGDGFPGVKTYSFDVTFECKVQTLNFSGIIQDQIYAIPQGLLQSNAYTVQQLPVGCDLPATITTSSVPDASTFVTLNTGSSVFDIQTTNLSKVNIFAITYSVTIPQETFTGSGINMSFSDTFQLQVLNPCDTTTLSFSTTPTDMNVKIGQGASVQTLSVSDSASTNYGNQDGSSLCGTRVYTISPVTYPGISINFNQITVESDDPSDAIGGPYSLIILVSLHSYPSAASVLATISISIDCEVTSLSWSIMPPTIYSHILQYDVIPASIPYEVTQNPLCGAILSYQFQDQAGLATPAWINNVPGSNLELNPINLALEGTYSLSLQATEVLSGVSSSSSTIQVDLVITHPCSSTTVSASQISDTIHHLLSNSPGILSSSIPFSDFTCDVTTFLGVNCGTFSYSVAPVNLLPQSLNPVSSLRVNTTANFIDIDIDKNLISSGLILTYNLTATLDNYPSVTHSESFQIKIYDFECQAEQISYEYRIGDWPLQIVFSNEQFPDSLLRREFLIYTTDAATSTQFDASSFVSLDVFGDENSSESVSLIVSSQIDTDAGFYTVGYRVIYAADQAEYLCSTQLEIKLNEISHQVNDTPRFVEQEAQGRFELTALNKTKTKAMVVDCDYQEWSLSLPSIVGEEFNKKVQIEVKLGQADGFLDYNQQERQFKMKQKVSKNMEGEFQIRVTLTGSSNLQSEYTLLIKLICPIKNELQSQDQDYVIEVDENAPIAFIDNIDSNGKVYIKFNSTMVPKYSLSQNDLHHNKSRLLEDESYLGQANPNFKNFTLIHNETVKINGTIYPSLGVFIKPDEPEDPCAKRLGFIWEIIHYEDDLLILQLTFEDHLCVSASTNTYDLIEVVFYDQRPFIDLNSNHLPPELTISKHIGRQILPEEQEAVELVIAVVASIILVSGAWSIITNTMMQTSLNKLISLAKNLQIIMHIMLIRIFCISHAEFFRNFLMKTINFEIIEYSKLFMEYLPVVQSEAFDSHFEASGYESSDCVINMGNTFVNLVMVPCIIVLLALIRVFLCKKYCGKGLNFLDRQLSKTVFNRILVLIDGSMIVICTSAWINIFQVKQAVIEQSFSYYFSISLLGLILLYSVAICAYLCRHYQRLEQEFFTRRIGSAFDYFAANKMSKSVFFLNFIMFARRIMIGYIITFQQENVLVQFYSIFFCSVLILMYMGSLRPFKTPIDNNIELFNEFMILVVFGHLICQTDLVIEMKARSISGWSLIACLCLQILINMAVIVYLDTTTFLRWYKIRKAKNQLKILWEKDWLKMQRVDAHRKKIYAIQEAEQLQEAKLQVATPIKQDFVLESIKNEKNDDTKIALKPKVNKANKANNQQLKLKNSNNQYLIDAKLRTQNILLKDPRANSQSAANINEENKNFDQQYSYDASEKSCNRFEHENRQLKDENLPEMTPQMTTQPKISFSEFEATELKKYENDDDGQFFPKHERPARYLLTPAALDELFEEEMKKFQEGAGRYKQNDQESTSASQLVKQRHAAFQPDLYDLE